MPTLYRDYKEFITAFTKRGGIIEAIHPSVRKNNFGSPSISIFLEPNGDY